MENLENIGRITHTPKKSKLYSCKLLGFSKIYVARSYLIRNQINVTKSLQVKLSKLLIGIYVN